MTEWLGSRIYYGWVMVAALAVTETVSWGVLYYAFSVFLVPMRSSLGWSDATLTGAYSLGLLVWDSRRRSSAAGSTGAAPAG